MSTSSSSISLTYRVSNDFIYDRNIYFNDDLQVLNKTFPWSSFDIAKSALVINLDNLDKQPFVNHFSEAFSVHAPDELPLFIKHEDPMDIESGKLLEVLVTPEVIIADDDLRRLSLEKRSCYLVNERQLRFYKVYNKRNCEIECFSNVSLEVCGCVPFDAIRDAKTQICGPFDYICLRKVKYAMKYSVESEMMTSCKCLSTCESVTYNYELIETRYEPM